LEDVDVRFTYYSDGLRFHLKQSGMSTIEELIEMGFQEN